MANTTKFNSIGFNAGTVSLVFVAASANFSAGIASADFGSGILAEQADFDWSISASAELDPILQNAIEASLSGAGGHNFEPSLERSGAGNWSIDSQLEAVGVAELHANMDLAVNGQLFANSDFRVGEAAWTSSGSTLDPDPNRVRTTTAPFNGSVTWLADEISGLIRTVEGSWSASGETHWGATLDTGLGYIIHDGFLPWENKAEWNNPLNAGIFTTGGFVSGEAIFTIDPNLLPENQQNRWAITADLSPDAGANRAAETTFVAEATLDGAIDRDAYVTASWTGRATMQGKVQMHRYGNWPLNVSLILGATSKSLLGARVSVTSVGSWTTPEGTLWEQGRMSWTGLNSVKFSGGIIWEQSAANWKAAAKLSKPKTDRTRLVNMRLRTTTSITHPVVTRIRTVEMYVSGLASTITASAVLRLVAAPKHRRFTVPEQNRYFRVTDNNNKFEVGT